MSIVGTILKGIKWREDTASPVTVRVDKNGFYIYWVCQNGETDTLEISSIRDTRTGKYARVPSSAKLRTTITISNTTDALEDKQIQIIYGSQLNNLDEINFSCATKELAQLWTQELMKMAHNIYAINACPLTFLKKAHAKLRFMVEKGDVLPVKKLTRMLTKDKVEMKRIEKALELTQLPSSRNDSILIDDFTFEKFLTFYKNLVQRQELEQIFDKLFPQAQNHAHHHHHHHHSHHDRHHHLHTSSPSFTASAFSSSSNSTPSSAQLGNYVGKYIDVETLVHFLNKHQRDPRLNEILHPYADRQRGLDIIRTYEPHKELAKNECLSYDGFIRYLLSEDNAIVAPEKLDLHQDMNQPLNHYFINSSHNTYLTGHQLRGKSSVDMYRQCLLAGCRCVELDCWNGRNNDDEPIITHGYTVVTEISFKDVLEAINESAFKTSPYPVILSFENHCSPKQQAKMVQYCKEIFSPDVLLTEPLSDYPLEHNVPLPSPNQLLKRIIIKNKKKHTKKGGGGGGAGAGGSSSNGGTTTSSSEDKLFYTPSLSSTQTTTCDTEESEIRDPDEESDPDEEELPPISELNGDLMEQSNHSQDIMVSPMSREAEPAVEMSELVVYLQPVRFKSFEESERRDRAYEVSSFAETQATSLLKERPIDFVTFNKRQFTRVYPKGTRVDSSNYIPQVYWNAGCQMVALNFQTFDLGMQLNMGLFDYNNRSGYILKPEFMRRPDKIFDPFTESTVDGIIAGTVSVQVISGQFLSEKRGNTFVEVEMYGLPADTARRRRTKVCQANGINPSWDDEPFLFKKIVLPDLASLRVAAYEEVGRSNRLIGYRILPVVGLRPGYRHLPLRSESNQSLTLPTLFLKVEVNDYVPDRLSDLADALANPIAHQSMVDRHARQLMVLNEQNEQAE